jgi:hypothetical protein
LSISRDVRKIAYTARTGNDTSPRLWLPKRGGFGTGRMIELTPSKSAFLTESKLGLFGRLHAGALEFAPANLTQRGHLTVYRYFPDLILQAQVQTHVTSVRIQRFAESAHYVPYLS